MNKVLYVFDFEKLDDFKLQLRHWLLKMDITNCLLSVICML